jgi:Mg/Co/Ni transporter MgtE
MNIFEVDLHSLSREKLDSIMTFQISTLSNRKITAEDVENINTEKGIKVREILNTVKDIIGVDTIDDVMNYYKEKMREFENELKKSNGRTDEVGRYRPRPDIVIKRQK